MPRNTEESEFPGLDKMTKISPPSRISICVLMRIASHIFSEKSFSGVAHKQTNKLPDYIFHQNRTSTIS